MKSTAKYHDLNIEIHGNHPLANSKNHSLSINGPEEHAVSAPAQPSPIPNPSPRGKGMPKSKH